MLIKVLVFKCVTRPKKLEDDMNDEIQTESED